MATIQDIKDGLNRKFGRDKRLEWKGVLGRADGTVDAGNHLVYVTLLNGDVITIHNGKVPNIPYKKIVFGYDDQYPDLLQVLKVEDVYDEAPVPNIANHKDSHRWFGYDPVEIAPEQFYPLLARAAGEMTLRVYGGNYTANGTYHTYPTTDLDLTSYIPVSGANWLIIELDENGDVFYTAGAEYANPALLVPENIPPPDTTRRLICAVKMYLGQSSIVQTRTRSDIYDPRFSGSVGAQNVYDASEITYTPATLSDWDCLADPGDVSDALDQLAERTTDLEAGGGGGGTPGGSDTEIQYNASGAFAGDAEFTWDDVTKALGIGDPSLLPGFTPDHTFWMVGDGVSPSQFMVAYGATKAPFLTFMKADGSGASPANVKDDQVIGYIRGRGYDGTGWTDTRIEIRFVADGDWGVNDTPTRIELWTCPDGSGTLTLAMTIGSDGNVNIASGKTYNINGTPHTHAYSAITETPTLREVLTTNRTYYVGYNLGTVTITIASPCVVTKTAHGLENDDPVVFRTTGALPTGITAGTTYYVINKTADTFQISTSAGGSAVNTSGTQSGTHSAHTGNDSNTGLATGRAGAFLTIQKAVNTIAALDISIYDVTIQISSGLFVEEVTTKRLTGNGTVTILGDATTPSNVVVTQAVTNGSTFLNETVGWKIRGVKVTATGTSGRCIASIGAGAHLLIGKIDFGTASVHIFVTNGGYLEAYEDYSITAGADYHLDAISGIIHHGLASGGTITVTLTGTPAFASAFALATRLAYIRCNATTFSGSATGVRYIVSANGVIFTNGGGASFLPGNSAGSTATGGQYL